MKIFQWRNAKELAQDTNAEASATTYKIGWQIYSKDGSMMVRAYENVLESERESIYNSVRKDVDAMYKALEAASKEDAEFVNLEGSLFRLADVVKVTLVNNKQSND